MASPTSEYVSNVSLYKFYLPLMKSTISRNGIIAKSIYSDIHENKDILQKCANVLNETDQFVGDRSIMSKTRLILVLDFLMLKN